MFISLSGLLRRLKGRMDQMFAVDELIRHFEMAKKANESGDKKTVD